MHKARDKVTMSSIGGSKPVKRPTVKLYRLELLGKKL